MKISIVMRALCISLFLIHTILLPTITFLDPDAKLVLGAGNFQGEVKVNTSRSGQAYETGQIIITNPNNIVGSTGKIFLSDAVLSNRDFDVFMTGTYDPNFTYSVILPGNGQFYATNPGLIPQRIWVRGSGNVIEGQPLFSSVGAIKFQGAQASATIGLLTELNSNLNLSGGTLNLSNNLGFGDNAQITGSGTINFNSFNLSTGQKSLTWTETLLLVGAKNLSLGGDSKLYGRWYFQNDAHIIGNNNIFDLSSGATLWVRKNTTVEMSDLILSGLGTGRIMLEDRTARLDMYNVTIDMNANYSFTTGGVYYSGPGKVNVGNHLLSFEQQATLTVDNVMLEYDPLNYNDINNVRFGPNGYKQTLRYVTYLNGGSVRKKDSLAVGDHTILQNKKLDRSFDIGPLRTLTIQTLDPLIDGGGFSYQFASNPTSAILIIGDNQFVQYSNILLKSFPLQAPGLSLSSSATVVFGPQTTIELGSNTTLTNTFYFTGVTAIDGKGKILDLEQSGQLILLPGSSLSLDNITIRGISGNQIRCMDDSCTLSLGDITWEQDGDYTFTRGSLYVKGVWDLQGTSTFGYQSSRPSTISRFGTVYVSENMTFSYAPPVANHDLIILDNIKSTFYLNNGTLRSTTTGIRLTVGTFIAEGHSFLENYGATSISEAISFGDGNGADDLSIIIGPGATLDTLTGILFYDQTE
jgi:hypothetical protein